MLKARKLRFRRINHLVFIELTVKDKNLNTDLHDFM